MASQRSSKKQKSKNLPPPPGGSAAPAEDSPTLAAPPSPSTPGWLPWIGFVLVLLAAITWVGVHAFLVDAVTVRLCEQFDKSIPAENRMPVFLSEIAFDGYTWNRHAEHLGENGTWRIRHTDFDNAPDGREVHWNSAFAWYLRGLGEIYRSFTGDSLRNSIFRMSIWANPILLILALGIFSTLSARRFGPLCGSVIAIGMVAVPTFYEGFMPAYPDHHGLIAFMLLGMLFGVAWAGAGWIQPINGTDFATPRSLRQARHGMIFSAICGAAGLWISAFSTAIVLGAAGLAALIAVLVYGRKGAKTDSVFHPELWKLWAVWGASGSIAFFLLEYFPSNMGVRMEVNHPLYALAWLGGGWGVAIVAEWLCRLGTKDNPFPWSKLILPGIACAILPLVVLLGGNEVYSAKDPFMIRLYKNIAELLPLIMRIQMGGLTWQMAFGWFPLFVLAALVLQFSDSVGRGTKAVLIFLSIPIFLITALQLYQVRWGMLAGPLYIALAGIVLPQVWKLGPKSPVAKTASALLLVALGFVFVGPTFRNCFQISWVQFHSGEKISLTPGQGLALIHRQMARSILDNAQGKPVVLLSSPNSSCLLSAIGGFRAIGTLYWENVEGLKSAAKGLNSQTDSEALAFIKAHGVTHISMMSWENFIEPYFRILYPDPVPGKSYQNSFAKRALFDKVIPPWSRPLAFPPNELTRGLQQTVLMLQVAPNQSIPEAKYHLARYVRLVEGNPISAEITLKEILDTSPDSSLVRFELFDLYMSQRRFREAADQALNAIKTSPSNVRASISADVANKLDAAGQADLAAEIRNATQPAQPN